ncbi:glutamate racemase [Synechococcus sp. PCC 7336]|uniref:glutamate racemase n=1 Tax=Synechococcus sp. PCC 7336 TaxID=195250 RepID=UPI000346396B|nr:glutamate racemase [Synechococcus sp. PCC 7336]
MGSVASTLPIGVFDSGVGGLTVWRELRRQLPRESFVYLGDTARLPYGGRSPAEILQSVREISNWMVQQPVKAIVMACNTSSALALEQVRHEFDVPMLGLILPGARAAVKRGQRIGAIATQATVNSHAYRDAILEINNELECWEVACPDFVPLIEAGQMDSPALHAAVREYLQPLLERRIDTLISGCTHYPLIEAAIRQVLPPSVCWIDPAVSLATAVKRELEFLGLRARGNSPSTRFCITGDDADRFAELAAQWIHPIAGDRILVEIVELLSIAPAAAERHQRAE